jgi:hypothetical protein
VRAARSAPARVVRYSIEIKHSAQKELDVLDDALFARIDAKVLALANNPRPPGLRRGKGPSGFESHPLRHFEERALLVLDWRLQT